jgi:hypothetical protein
MSSLRKYATLAGIFLGVWLVMVGLILADLFPYRPSTPLGWVALFILGPPAYLLLEALGEAGMNWISRTFRRGHKS